MVNPAYLQMPILSFTIVFPNRLFVKSIALPLPLYSEDWKANNNVVDPYLPICGPPPATQPGFPINRRSAPDGSPSYNHTQGPQILTPLSNVSHNYSNLEISQVAL